MKKQLIQVTGEVADMVTLWVMLRDLLTENQAGFDSGRGGMFPPADGLALSRVMESVAKAVDKTDFDMKGFLKVDKLKLV